jgi:ABC-type nickel/cobalt efflux system permease component RcnA
MTRTRRFRPGRIFYLALASWLILLCAAPLLRPSLALAHPLGNFTINRYARIEVHPHRIYLRYILDMAEIPAFQERNRIDLDRDGQIDDGEGAAYLSSRADQLKNAMRLTVDGSSIPLEIVSRELSFPSGQGGLPTLRLSLLIQEASPPDRIGRTLNLHYQDDNYRQRLGQSLGWKEIVARAAPGVLLIDSTAPQEDRSDELQGYPDDLLSNPPELNEVRLTFAANGNSGPPAGAAISQVSPDPDLAITDPATPDSAAGSGMTSLITANRLSWPVITLAVLLALGLGAAHALTPGHGKTIMAAYLVGTRGTARHALTLGLTVTVAHTLGVLGLGLVTLFFSSVISPELLYPWLSLVSGVTIIGVGIWMLTDRWRHRSRKHQLDHHHGDPSHDHQHDHPHSHRHPGHHHRFDFSDQPGSPVRKSLGWKNLAALGVSNGLIPSASALIILLAAIALQRIGLGLLLVLAFSAGMAAVLSGIGVVLVYCGRIVQRFRVESAWSDAIFRLLPLGTALVILISGLVVAARSVRQVGLL